MRSVDQEAATVPLNKKIHDLTDELDKFQRVVKTLEIELKERDELISRLKAGGAIPSASGPDASSTAAGSASTNGPASTSGINPRFFLATSSLRLTISYSAR